MKPNATEINFSNSQQNSSRDTKNDLSNSGNRALVAAERLHQLAKVRQKCLCGTSIYICDSGWNDGFTFFILCKALFVILWVFGSYLICMVCWVGYLMLCNENFKKREKVRMLFVVTMFFASILFDGSKRFNNIIIFIAIF